MLSENLLKRIKARAANSKMRTDVPDPSDLPIETFALKIGNIFGTMAMGPGQFPAKPAAKQKPLPLAEPVSADEMAKAEKKLGFSLPEDLKQLYLGVADGGFGPGGGIATLRAAIAHYEDLCANPPGERGQIWPKHLFPFVLWDLGCDCIDLNTGEIVFWDEEMLAEGPSDSIWKKSFQKSADDLAAYMKAWLTKAPPNHDGFIDAIEEGLNETFGEFDRMRLEGLRNSIEAISAMSAADRKKIGLPDENWEEALCEMRGFDPKIYLQLLKLPKAD